MNTTTTAKSTAHAVLARRKKATALALRLAKAKAESMEAVYGFKASMALRHEVAELTARLARLTA
jgi:hypothetical protein